MILGFSGKLGSGKDTAGERLATLVDLPSERISFAALLKESAAALFDIDPQDWETYKNDPDVRIKLTVGWETVSGFGIDLEEPKVIRDFSAREILQRYGTESHRDVFSSDFWVEQALVNYVPSLDEFAYVTDCRFLNEARAIRELGGHIIRVSSIDEEDTVVHVSESPLPDELITFEIDNSVRDDDYRHLDSGLKSIAWQLGLPLKELA